MAQLPRFTATLIFQLIEDGKLSLDTPLSDFYPQIKNADDITIAMMLSHRSGIHNYTNLPDLFDTAYEPKSKQEMIKLLASLDSDFTPGSKASYSNSAYMLLGFIVEDISGKSYAQQLQTNILNKLSLTETAYGDTENNSHNAKSYVMQEVRWRYEPEIDFSLAGPAGAIVATPGDVARFMSALFAGKLISPASLMKMKENVDGFGHGLARYPFHKKTLYGHDGSVDGFRAFTAIQEQDDVAVAITANGVNYSLNDITVAAFSSYYGLDFEIPDVSQKAVNLSDDALQKFEGTFASKAVPLKITITRKDGQLSAQATGQRPLPLTPFSETEFRFEPAGIAIVFDSGEAGINEHRFVLRQGGGEYPFIRE